jgi:sirohydrochlorin ferrochelatase
VSAVFLILTDTRAPGSYAAEVRHQIALILGFELEVQVAPLPDPRQPDSARSFAAAIDQVHEAGSADAREIFVLPATLEFNLWQRETLAQVISEARRGNPALAIHHDDPDLADPLIVDALAERAAEHISDARGAGILLLGNGCGDPASRAHSYRLMRLLWERLGVATGEVAFVRHAQPFLSHALDQLDPQLHWVLIPQSQWPTETVDYARVILENSKLPYPFADPPGADPRMIGWLANRAVQLWRARRSREDRRERSPKSSPPAPAATWQLGGAIVAAVPDRDAMRTVISQILPPGPHDRVIVKVTWHGYATGTYTDPAALDVLLGSLPARAIILEGHTSSRNRGEARFDWETDACANRAWIRQQDAEFLRRTGLAEVMARHHAQYINVTECFWDEDCATPEEIGAHLNNLGIVLHHPELLGFVPRVLFDLRGAPRKPPMISFAKIKGPTRLAISNMFGLIPHPLRAAWHGPNITHFARVCCDLAKLYGSLFHLVAVNEGLYSAVRWDRRGLYRSRWGNYDLITDAGHLVASGSLVAADIATARLQGQDVSRSAFFDVVRAQLGWDDGAEQSAVPARLHSLLA